MTFESITNRGEFFSNHYLDAIIAGDLGEIRTRWDEAEEHDKATARSRIRSLPRGFFDARAAVADSSRSARPDAIRSLHDLVLEALGFTPDRQVHEYVRATVDILRATTAARVEAPTGLHLLVIDAGFADDVDDLFADADGDEDPASLLLEPCARENERKLVTSAPEAVNEFFGLDDPPRFVLVLAGSIVLLAERAKWAEGRYLAVDLDAALERNDTRSRGELETIAALFSADALVADDGHSVLDELVEKSHKHAVGVSKELRNGIRESIEILANEVIEQRWARSQERHDRRLSSADAGELTRQCLRYLYRLLVLLYAESRPELGVLPANDDVYLAGYSLDRLRELVLVDLDTDAARNGSHFDESLTRLFELVNDGYHSEHAQQQLVFDPSDEPERSDEEYLLFPGLDAALFDPKSTNLLDEVTLRNEALQRVLSLLMLSTEGKGKKARADRGFISYAQLGINQLGAVYEGLMAYTGFFADEDLYEVAKDGDPSDGTWVLPVTDADEYPDEVFVKRIEELTGKEERILHPKGSFVFRLSGRDRQRSASYYTPEVLTKCVVKHALAELLGADEYAPEHGSSGIKEGEAVKILDLTICEPALGSGAFANEAINQLSAEYLRRRQAELGETLDPEAYLRELQKVKSHFALHQTYGVDLNATAVELAEVSIWLNAMYAGLKAPWFGLRLRRGNSLIGCRRATWKTSQLGDRPWAKTKKGEVQPPTDRKLSDGPLDPDEIHHFLLPGHGWAAVADRNEAKELRPDEVERLKDWRKRILAAPRKSDARRLVALAEAVETMWHGAAERIRLTQQALRRPIEVYGATIAERQSTLSRAAAEEALSDPNSPLGRLRTLMDTWIGLWFWPLDTGVNPPTWEEWLKVAEEITRTEERHGVSAQLELFENLTELLEAQQRLSFGQPSVASLRERFSWLGVAVDAARSEGAWHWELEFAPLFQHGGFDVQVGNPPWVRLRWYEDLVLAELDSWWGITDKPTQTRIEARRQANLVNPPCQDIYLSELTSIEGTTELLSSPTERPLLTGVQTNLYMVFMDTTWHHLAPTGTVGLLHPEGHLVDPSAGQIRRNTYRRLRRHFQFSNDLMIFEDVGTTREFGINIYGAPDEPRFLHITQLLHPSTADASISHDGDGPQPGLQYPQGGWDLRPHRARLVEVVPELLAAWAALFDLPGTPASEARLLRPVTVDDASTLNVLSLVPERFGAILADWTRGHEDDRAKRDGIIRWDTQRVSEWCEVVVQGPHFAVALPFAKEPNEHCRNKNDWSELSIEQLHAGALPRTNYVRACSRERYDSSMSYWDGTPAAEHWRMAWRRRTEPGIERSLVAALLPPGPAHVNSVLSARMTSIGGMVRSAGLWSTLPVDYLVKVSGRADVQYEFSQRLPDCQGSRFESALLLRTARLNCLTQDYAPLWAEVWNPVWQYDRWTAPELERLALGDVRAAWTSDTPLRRDFERRFALVELDALAALMLGLSAQQLCAMYRTQFAVLRKYEYQMVFDLEGRKICGHHQSAGYRQSRLQDQAKAGELPSEWKSLWKLYEQYEADPDSVDWLGNYTPPFYRPDREMEMTRAYNEFQRRLEAGEYE
jgi:hypothetical protein